MNYELLFVQIIILIIVKFSMSAAFVLKRFDAKTCSAFSKLSKRYLNRIFFDAREVTFNEKDFKPTVTLPIEDFRAQHMIQVLKLEEGDAFRAGVLNDQLCESCTMQLQYGNFEESQPSKTSKSSENNKLSSVTIVLHDYKPENKCVVKKPSVDLLLATPRPARLVQLLPVISSLGIDNLVLLGAEKVRKDYFGSHLFRDPHEMRKLLVDGLMQAAVDCHVPTVLVQKELDKFFVHSKYLQQIAPTSSNEIQNENDNANVIKLIAHPLYSDLSPSVLATKTSFQEIARKQLLSQQTTEVSRVVVAVGPEGGWLPQEVQQFVDRGFLLYPLGERILRTDTAVTVLLSQAHEILRMSQKKNVEKCDVLTT